VCYANDIESEVPLMMCFPGNGTSVLDKLLDEGGYKADAWYTECMYIPARGRVIPTLISTYLPHPSLNPFFAGV
jgi:hypothetical protein